MNAIETIEIGRPRNAGPQRELPPAVTALAGLGELGADEIMVLEGGDVPELGDVLGESGLGDPETSAVDGADLEGFFGATREALQRRKQRLRHVIAKRRSAICSAHTERVQLEKRVGSLDRLIVDVLAPKLRRARQAGDRAEARRVENKMDRLDLARGTAAARAIRYANTEGLGQVLTRNARTQANLLELMGRAQARGDWRAANELGRAFNELAGKTRRYKNVRKKQVRDWRNKTSAGKYALSRVLRKQAERELAELRRRPVSSVSRGRAEQRANALGTRIGKLRQTEERERAKLRGLSASAAAGAARALSSFDQGEVLASLELGDLEFFSSLKKYAKKAGGAIVGGAKKIGGAVKSGVKKVGSAAKRLAKKAACKVASNPKVLAAAGSAVGSVVGGPAGTMGGAMASKAAGSMLKGACGTSSPKRATKMVRMAFRPLTLGPVKTSSSTSELKTSKAVPVAVGGAAAAAALLLVLL